MHPHSSHELIFVIRGPEWPFPLIVQVGNNSCTYTPNTDFLVLKSLLPHLLVEVNSTSPDTSPRDLHRMLIQGACIVRFANLFVDAYSEEKKFTLVAVFIRDDGQADRYLLFQSQSVSSASNDKVCICACISNP